VLLHFLIGAIAAIVSFAAPVQAARAVENCADNARALLAALKHTALWQIGMLNARAPELTEAEFVKVCEDLPPSNELSEFLVRKFTAGQEKREIVPVDAIPERVAQNAPHCQWTWQRGTHCGLPPFRRVATPYCVIPRSPCSSQKT
jgi:hypothetical protein